MTVDSCHTHTPPAAFNHHLFEAIAALVSNVCKSDPSGAVVGQFEVALFPPFNAVLGEQVTEFSPYVFQILAQLLEFNSTHAALASKPLSPNYTVLFPLLLNPVNWMNRGDVPALVRLVAAYLIKVSVFIYRYILNEFC